MCCGGAGTGRGFEGLPKALISNAAVPLKTEVEVVVEGEWRGHSLLRVELLNMSRIAHHHFDYAKDTHSRVYDMRFKRGPRGAAEQVYRRGMNALIRREDSAPIP